MWWCCQWPYYADMLFKEKYLLIYEVNIHKSIQLWMSVHFMPRALKV